MKHQIPIGTKYGRLTIIGEGFYREIGSGNTKVTYFPVRCDCGKELSTQVYGLLNGKSSSCGCLNRERLSARNRQHRDAKTPLYRCWSSMKARCNIPSATGYHLYGAKGVKVCDEWRSYLPFAVWARTNGYEEGLTIDRINNSKGYCPENCRFVTKEDQQRNKTTNWKITAFGETKILIEWAEDPRAVTSAEIISERIRRGIDPETAITFKGQAYSQQKLVPAK